MRVPTSTSRGGQQRRQPRSSIANPVKATINTLIDKTKKHPRLTACGALVLLYGLLGFFLAPYLLEQNLVRILKQDYDAELRVEEIAVNPFVLSLHVKGLELDNPAGQPNARIGEIFVNLQLSSLLRMALTFDEIRLASVQLFVARDSDGNFDFAYLLKPAADGAGADEPAGAEASALFPLLVYDFTLEDASVDWLDHYPVEPVETRFGPISVNIRELNTLPDRSGQQTVNITTDRDSRLSWTGDLQLNPLKSSGSAVIEGSFFPLASAYFRHQAGVDIVNGITLIELDYTVAETSGGELQARVEQINISVNDIAVNSFADGTGFDFAGPDTTILAIPQLRVENGEVHWPEQTLSVAAVTIENPQINLSRDRAGVFNLQPASQAGAAATQPSEPPASTGAAAASGSDWRITLGQLSINELALELLDSALEAEVKHGIEKFNLKVTDISNQPGQRFPTSLSLRVASGGQLSLDGAMTLLPEPVFEFDIALDALQLAAAEPYIQQQLNLNFNSGALYLGGHVHSSSQEPLSFRGDLEITELELAESLENRRVAAWQKFRAEQIDLSLAERRVDISSLVFDRLYGDVEIDRQRQLNVTRVSRAEAPGNQEAVDTSAATGDATDAGPAFQVQIGDIELVDASVDFSDLSLPLPFRTRIDALNGKVSTVASASTAPAELAFEGKVDEFGLVQIDGFITPLDPPKNTDVRVNFENIDLPPLSPYSIPFAGRKIDGGRLDLKLGYQVKDSNLVGANRIVLRNFELGEEVPSEDALNLPLDLAVALLTDIDGKIDIDLPISGNVDEPEFSYAGVVWKALGDLLVKIVLSPFAALGNMLGIDASELEHIDFIAGRSDLTPPQREKAANLARALAQRPQLRLVVAGAAEPQVDATAIRSERLDAMLQARIDELAAAGTEGASKTDLRQAALEQLFSEQPGEGSAAELEALQQQFTTPVVVEGQAEPVPTLDNLAYSNELRRRLVAAQPVGDEDLGALASARAEALVAELLALDPSLRERVSLSDNEIAPQDPAQPVQMKISLESIE